MSLYSVSRKKGTVWYSDFRWRGKRYVHCLGTVTKTQARHIEQVIRAQLIEGRYLPPEPHPAPRLRDFAQRYYEWYASHHRPLSNRSYRLALESIANHFPPETCLDELSQMAVEGFKQALSNRLAPRTVNFRLHVLGHLIRTALEWEVLASDPLKGRKVRRLREETPPTRVLAVDEETRLLERAAPHLRPLLVFGLHTGLRCGELIGLQWSQLDLARQTVTVEGRRAKNRRTRVIPLNDEAMRVLREQGGYRREAGFPLVASADTSTFTMPIPTQHVFLMHKGTPYTDSGVRRTLAYTVQHLGLTGVSLHTLRHTFASRLLEAGYSIREVQELLGHASIVQTSRYTHVSQARLREAVASLVRRGEH